MPNPEQMRVSSLRSNRRLLLLPCSLLVALSLQVGHVQAELSQHPPGWERLQPAQQRELAQVRRRWELDSHSRRVFILQMSERCIRSAFTAEAYRACKRKERQATFALRLEGLERINALRTHYGLAPLLDPQLDLRSPQFTVQPIKKAAPSGAATA
ncbi:putative conserved secreted protein [Synechococcus sp. BMK-MC-1]|nr:putative conserved secreted protein [Synechococcus sp. BMK-MC-1]